MIDKELIKKRFKKSLKTYDDNAYIQKYTAKKLIDFLEQKKYNKVFEIGCSTGILTKQIKENIDFESYTADDIVAEAKNYIVKIIPEVEFIEGDIEEIPLNEKYDLIISNACLQWCSDIEKTVKKLYQLLSVNGVLLFSVFGNENLKEIYNIFQLLKKDFNEDTLVKEYKKIKIEKEIKKIYFDNPKAVLEHLKYTGTNAMQEYKLTKKKLQNYENTYKKMYSEGEKVYLTYNPVYVKIIKPTNDIE